MKLLKIKFREKNADISKLSVKLCKFSSRVSFDIERGIINAEINDEEITKIVNIVKEYGFLCEFTIEEKSVKVKNDAKFEPPSMNFEDEEIKQVFNNIYWLLYNKSMSDAEINKNLYNSFILLAKLVNNLSKKNSIETDRIEEVQISDDTVLESDANDEEKEVKKQSGYKKHLGTCELAILEMLKPSLETMKQRSDNLEEQIPIFLDDIGFYNDEIVVSAFICAKSICDKLSYDKLIAIIKEKVNNKSDEEIRKHLQLSFKSWIEDNYPSIKRMDKRISFLYLLRVFYYFLGCNQFIGTPQVKELTFVDEAIEKLDKKDKIENQISDFLKSIGMNDDKLIQDSFIVACDIKKITFDNVAVAVKSLNPKLSENTIVQILKNESKMWAEENKGISSRPLSMLWKKVAAKMR